MRNIFEKLKKTMEKDNIKRYIIAGFIIIVLLFIYTLLNYSELISVYSLEKEIQSEIKQMDIVVGGEAVGIKLLATGVLVMSIDREDVIDLKIGDIILSVNGTKIETNAELSNLCKSSNGNSLKLKVSRDNSTFETSISPIKDEMSDEYKLGLWVKDSSAGVGTVTFYDRKNAKFAALGHGVTETKENYILPIESGGITKTQITGLQKGESRSPGELKGTITLELIGQILGNTDKGIYGQMVDNGYYKNKKSIEILSKSKIQEKEAKIYCTLDNNKVEEYNIAIEKVLLTSTGNKNMIIKITDTKLIEKTGGIIQGMSGSPIVQDGKLIGAVTHVFLNDPTRGYGVFIENMIQDLSSID